LRGAWCKPLMVVMMAALSAHFLYSQASQPAGKTPPVASTSSPNYEGMVVGTISFPDVLGEAQRKVYLDLVPQKVDQPLDRQKVRESLQALYATGRFADVRAEADRTGDGKVALSFRTKPNYFVGDVSVEGNPSHPTAGQIINASKLDLGAMFSRDELDRALEIVRQLMQQNGYYRSKVTTREIEHPETSEIDVVFQIESGPSAHVGTVTVKGNQTYSQQQIQDIAKIHPGDQVTAARTTNALERLRKKYQKQERWLTQVRISSQVYNPVTNAVDYAFEVVPGPKIRIETEGFKFSRSQLKRLVPVFQENALDDDLLNEGRRNILNYLQDHGYFEAKVEYQRHRRPNAQNELVVTYKVDAGGRHKVVKLEITGNQYFDNQALRSHMQIQVAEKFLSRGRYSQRLLSDDVSAIENLYRSNGFRQVKVTSNVEDDYDGHKDELAITVHVDEGPQTRIASLSILGNIAVPTDTLLERLNSTEGQPFSELNISQDRDNVLNYYFNNGFPEATFSASAKPVADNPNAMDVTYTIHEGNQVLVGNVYLSGLEHTKRSVATREIQVKPNDPLSQLDILNTQQRLYDLGIFSQVDTAVQNPEGAEQYKNVLVNVTEAKRYTFNYGLGLEFQTGQPSVGTNTAQGETGISPRLSFGVTRLNVGGRNHTLSFKMNVGRLQQRGLIGYEAPRWLTNPNLKFSASLSYDNTIDVTTFTSERLEGAIRLTENLNRISSMEYRFTYRRVQATNLPTNTSLVLLPLLSQPARVGMPGFTYIRDKRDNALDPGKGNYTTINGEVASQYFGSERDFSRFEAQNSTYYAFGKNPQRERKIVFARSTRIGIETPFAGTVYVRPGLSSTAPTIPLPELLLAGGGNSHRGFGLNQAGPRDPNSGFPIGGSAMFINNLELRFPPVSLPFVGNNLSLAVFHDAGNIFINGHDMLHNLLRWRQKDPQLCLQDSTAQQCDYSYVSHAIGIGVRYKTPIGPVRFDFGYNLNPPAFPSCQTAPDPNNPASVFSPRCDASDPFDPNNPDKVRSIYFVPQHTRRFNVFFSIGQTF
jgi:outer membrane protein insertion porin family